MQNRIHAMNARLARAIAALDTLDAPNRIDLLDLGAFIDYNAQSLRALYDRSNDHAL